jgi:hypothetical protein
MRLQLDGCAGTAVAVALEREAHDLGIMKVGPTAEFSDDELRVGDGGTQVFHGLTPAVSCDDATSRTHYARFFTLVEFVAT